MWQCWSVVGALPVCCSSSGEAVLPGAWWWGGSELVDPGWLERGVRQEKSFSGCGQRLQQCCMCATISLLKVFLVEGVAVILLPFPPLDISALVAVSCWERMAIVARYLAGRRRDVGFGELQVKTSHQLPLMPVTMTS